MKVRYRVSYLTDGSESYLLLARFPKLARGISPYLLASYFRQKLNAEPANIHLLSSLSPVSSR